jgi:hypothetical protein
MVVFRSSIPANALPPDEIVVISYVGYQEKEIPLSELEKSGALIELSPGALSLKEIQIIASTLRGWRAGRYWRCGVRRM